MWGRCEPGRVDVMSKKWTGSELAMMKILVSIELLLSLLLDEVESLEMVAGSFYKKAG